MRRALLAAVVAAACSKDAPRDATVADAAIALPSAPVSMDASSPDPEGRAREIVVAWSDALDRHDVAALGRLYADRLDFYGRSLSREAVLDAKKKALASAPDFHQSIVGPIAMTHEGSVYTATFTKRSGAGKMTEVSARVVVTDGHVIVETDGPSSATRLASCEEVAAGVVNQLPQVKKVLADDARTTAGSTTARMGGIGSQPEPTGGFTAGMGIHTDERYEAHVWYTVNGAGVLSVTVYGEDLPVAVAALAKVRAACAK